jgi:hypothetical protein
MFGELEHLIRTRSDHEALSEQSCLREMLIDLRQVADDLGLDFRLAYAGAKIEENALPSFASFDPCI